MCEGVCVGRGGGRWGGGAESDIQVNHIYIMDTRVNQIFRTGGPD